MEKITTDLFLLMSNLSQVNNSDRVISIFTEAINSFSDDFEIEYTADKPMDGIEYIEISTIKCNLGYFICRGAKESISPEINSLFQNAIQMLAVLLERLNQEKILADEKEILKTIVDEKTKSIIDSEENYRILFNNIKQGVFYHSTDGLHTDINAAALKMFGLTKDEFLSRDSYSKLWKIKDEYGETLSPDKFPSQVALSTGKPQYSLVKIVNQTTNKDVWAEISAIPEFKQGESKPYRVIVTMNDITERKNSEEEIQKSEMKYRTITENTFDMISLLDLKGVYLFCNNAFLDILGYEADSLVGTPALDIIEPEDREKCINAFSDFVNNKYSESEIVFRLICKRGERKWISHKGRLLYDENNIPEKVLLISHDITKQKVAEEELNLKSLVLNQIRDNVTITDLDGNIIDVNNAEIDTLGFSRDQLIGKTVQIFGEDTTKGVSQAKIIFETIKTGSWRGEVVNFTKEGKELILDCRTSVIYDNEGKRIALCGISTDITEQKKAETEIKNLLERLNLAAKASKFGIWDWDIHSDNLEWDDRMYELYGISDREIKFTIEKWLTYIYPEDRCKSSKAFDAVLFGADTYDTDFKIVLPDGSVKFIKANGIVLQDSEGNALRLTGVNFDITEQKQAEIERNVMIELYSLINNTTNKKDLIHEVVGFLKKFLKCEAVGIRIKDKNDFPYYETIGFDDEFVRCENSICAVDNNNEIIRDFRGIPLLECVCGSIINGRYDKQKPFFTNHGSFWTNNNSSLFNESPDNDTEKIARNRCQKEGYESVGLFPFKTGNQTYGLLQINDKRKGLFNPNTIKILERISDALAISLLQYYTFETLLVKEEIHREILRTAIDGFWRIDLKGKILEVNQAWCNMSGYSEIDMLNKYVKDFEAKESPKEIQQHMEELIIKGGIKFETRHKCKNGSIIDVEVSSSYSPLDHGQIFSFIRDITQRKLNEEAMRISNERYRQSEYDLKIAQSVAHLGSWKWNIKTGDVYFSDEMFNILGIDKNIKLNLLSTAVCEVMHPDDLHMIYPTNINQLLKQKHAEFRIILPNGSQRWIAAETGENYYDNEGNLTFITGIAQDITERKCSEEQLRSSLKEKEVLIRELYHRTKNNMQVICGILKLKSGSIKEEKTISILNEMENRIRSMALVHQKLYQSQNLSKVNLKDYISELAELLTRSYKISSEKIKLILELEKVEVLIDTAIPCGLIINELVSNSLKYAFPEDLAGEIKLNLKKTIDGEIELFIADNGVGIPDDFNVEECNTLGYQIIHGIANDQLQGKVKYETHYGVSFKVVFRDSLYSERV